MKKTILILLITYFSAGISFAQDNSDKGPDNEKIQALEIAFLSRKLDLTPDEAKKFWPIYNEYRNEMQAVLRNRDVNESVLDRDERILNIRKKYRPKFESVIGPQRFNRFLQAEVEYRRLLLNQIRKNRATIQRRGQ